MSEKFLNGQRTGELWDAVKNYVNGKGDAPAGSNVPTGGIIIWSGSAGNIPEGWALCDGANGTPDLRDRFVMGAGKTYDPGSMGGEARVTLTEAEMPKHVHGFQATQSSTNSTMIFNVVNGFTVPAQSPLTTLEAGQSAPHNNLPPYYTLCFIMKL